MREETNINAGEILNGEPPVIELPKDKVPEDAPFTEEANENLKAVDENDPLSAKSIENIEALLKNLEGMVQIMESQWNASARELDLKDHHMRALAEINMKYRQLPPEHLTPEQLNDWDYLNGIDKITDDEINAIFEEGHKVRGVDHSQTVDRIKGACQDFFGWLQTVREYRNVHDAYLQLLELKEEEQIKELRETAEKEEDPEKKQAMLNSIEMYYNRKYLKWLAEPVDDASKERIVKALSDEKKVAYWINRCRDRLKQMKISSKFILECSQFEKRFLEEKYHKNSNVLLLYFMQTAIYQDPNNKKDDGRTKTVCMVMAIDAIVRNTMTEDNRTMVLDHIRKFEDQFLDLVPEKA